jgi:hypothetical protein
LEKKATREKAIVLEREGEPSFDRPKNKKKLNLRPSLDNQTRNNKNSADKKQLGAPLRIGEGATFHSLSTDAYSLHCLESPTGLKFVLTTTESEGGAAAAAGASASGSQQQTNPDVRDVLARVYAYAFVDGAARSPAFRRGEPFAFELFSQRLRACLGPLLPDGGGGRGTAAR